MVEVEKLTEEQFVELYGKVVAKAKELLAERNKVCGDNWPAGQSWDGLGGSSKGIFMTTAREALEIDGIAFLKIVRNWPFSEAAWDKIDELFGR